MNDGDTYIMDSFGEYNNFLLHNSHEKLFQTN